MLTSRRRIDRLWDMHEIENLMGKYAYLHTARMHDKTVDLFARERNDVWVDVNGIGLFEGQAGIKKFFYDFHMTLDGKNGAIGQFNEHSQTTPVIEVAADGKTAKGVWISPGVETRVSTTTGQLQAYWCWGKYAVEFIKEKQGWRFWHFTITTEIFCEYEKSWVEYSPTASTREVPMSDKPSQVVPVLYSKDFQSDLVPVPPEPYETYDGNTMTAKRKK